MAPRKASRSNRLFLLASVAGVLIGALALTRVFTPEVLQGVSFSKELSDRNVQPLRLTLSLDEKYRIKTGLREVDPRVLEALLLLEDRHFYEHPGINPISFMRALGGWLVGDPQSGGSTITMQLARVRYGLKTRTALGKLRQIIAALRIELKHSKHEILEAYLNLAPYGSNIEGIGAASQIYFGKRPNQLTLPEILLLNVIPQSPSVRGLAQGGLVVSPGTLAARDRLARKWSEKHPQSASELQDLDLPLASARIREVPFRAPHFSEVAVSASGRRLRIRSSLDLSLQKKLEKFVENYVRSKEKLGVRNASALLVEYATGKVRALVGSRDYFDDQIHGQVNGMLGLRSPGSTLKPFAFALALDQGLIHPLTLLKDVPKSFGLFDPENFDRKFLGPMSARDALIQSRNLPAVDLARKLKNPTLFEFLVKAGLHFPKPERHYGLGLVLGGAETTGWDLAGLYAMLARGGSWTELKVFEEESTAPTSDVRLLSKEAAYLTLDMLTHNLRPDRPFREAWVRHRYPVAWKTGTSFGYRDAWTVGVVGPHVLVVWLGNFDGETNPAFVGRDLAAPLFFQLADALSSEPGFEQPTWRTSRGLGLKQVEVCAVSGGLPSAACPHRVKAGFIPGVSPIHECKIHRHILVDRGTGLRTCGAPSERTELRSFEFWPTDLLQLFRQASVNRSSPPRWDPACQFGAGASPDNGPRITSPREEVTYLRSLGTGASLNTISLAATSDAEVRSLYWFLGQRFLGKSSPEQPLLVPAKVGSHWVSVVDDLGRSDRRKLVVQATK